MLRKYRNALFEAIQIAGLNAQDFSLGEEALDGRKWFAVRFREGPRFLIDASTDFHRFQCRHSRAAPGYPLTISKPVYRASFDEILKIFVEWLRGPVRDIVEDESTPDLWVSLHSDTGSEDSSIPNTAFTTEERKRIAANLRELETESRKRGLINDTQIAQLQVKVEYLIAASERLGRKDWLAAAAGALIGFTFQAALTSNAAREFLRLGGEVLKWLAHTPLLLP